MSFTVNCGIDGLVTACTVKGEIVNTSRLDSNKTMNGVVKYLLAKFMIKLW